MASNNTDFRGLIAAPLTPFHPDGSLNTGMVQDLANFLNTHKVQGAFICGTTGEGYSLSSHERKALTEKWMEYRPDSFRIITHVGQLSQKEACELAKHSGELKVDGISVTAPSFFKPATLQDLTDYCGPIAESAPETPFYYYHIPSMTGVDFSMNDWVKLARQQIPTLRGIKYSHWDLSDLQSTRGTMADDNSFEIFFGRDEMLLPGLSMGATGAVGSNYNFAGDFFTRIIEAFQSGDIPLAQQLQSRAGDMINIMIKFGIIQSGKAVLSFLGMECGPLRSPLRELSDKEKSALKAELDSGGFFEDCLNSPLS